MAFGLSASPTRYILESDRELKKEEQTIFFIRSRTLEDENEIASLYRTASSPFKKGSSSWSKKGLLAADIESFKVSIDRVENYFIPLDCVKVGTLDALDYFTTKLQGGDSSICEAEINGKKYLRISSIIGDEIKYVAVTLSSQQRIELIDASEDINKLKEFEKKG